MSNGKVWHTAPDSCEGGPPPNNAINRTPDQVVFCSRSLAGAGYRGR
jgi:hypothetical protein